MNQKRIATIIMAVAITIVVGVATYFVLHRETSAPATGGVSGGLIALTLRDQNGKLQIFTITPDGTNKKQLTFDGENGRPDWSPDGRKIAFISMRDGKAWVAVMDADGSNQKLLVEGVAPDWSPDGEQIAFSRPDDRQIVQIWVINADGSNIRQITQSDTTKIGPSWSSDGKEMVFILPKNPGSPTDPQPEIGIMNADGTNERILTTEDRTNTDGSGTVCETANDANAPAWSPVDNRVAFWSGIENQYGQVWVINSDGTGSKQLTEDCSHGNSDDPSWSPDGEKILFSTGRSGRNELWVMDADGSNEKRLSDIDAGPFPGRASWQPTPTITPSVTELTDPMNTSLIVFSAMDASNRVQIYSVKPDGSDKKPLTDQGNNLTPSWTPDGKQIIFASDRSGAREIYFMNEDGSGVSQSEISVVGNKLTPRMSHDLSQIAFAAENPRTGHPEIWVVNADGTVPRQLTDTPKANAGPTWSLFPRFSLDDSKILYASTQSGSSQIWIMNGDGSGKQQLTNGVAKDFPDANAPNWSPDGAYIVFWAGYETRYGEIWVMDADGTNPKQLTDQPAPISSDNPAWSPDGSKIIFDTNRSRSSVEVWIMDANGSNQQKLIGEVGAGGVMQMSWRPGLHGKGLPPNNYSTVSPYLIIVFCAPAAGG